MGGNRRTEKPIVVAYNAIFIMIYLIVFQLPFLHLVVFINGVCDDYTTV